MKIKQLINNELVLGDGPKEKIINPFNSEIITEIPQSSVEQVELAVQSAKSAFTSWSQTTPADRSAMLLKVADMIEENAEEIARIESLNCGKPYHLVLNADSYSYTGTNQLAWRNAWPDPVYKTNFTATGNNYLSSPLFVSAVIGAVV